MTRSTLPTLTLPPEIRDASAWYGPELKDRVDWIERLSAAEVAEVERAASKLAQSQVDLTTITAEDAPLPTLGPRLRGTLEEVVNGRGFVLIKGLPIDRWSKREAAIAFLVIGVHLGRLRMQNADGHLLGHVKDLGRVRRLSGAGAQAPSAATVARSAQRATAAGDLCRAIRFRDARRSGWRDGPGLPAQHTF